MAVALAGSGCSGSKPVASETSDGQVPGYVVAPPTREQRLVETGAQLVIADGCTGCHLPGGWRGLGPNFASFAGHRVTLRDGRSELVDQRFLTRALTHPGSSSLRGFDPRPMVEALRGLGLSQKPRQVAALVAFIEQVGPETE